MKQPSLTPAADAAARLIEQSAALAAHLAAAKPHLGHFFAAQHTVTEAMLRLTAVMHDRGESPRTRASAGAHLLVVAAQCLGHVTDEQGESSDLGAMALSAALEVYLDPSLAAAEAFAFTPEHVGPAAGGNA